MEKETAVLRSREKIGAVAKHLGETTATVRYWCDFFELRTERSKNGQRLFASRHVEKLEKIQQHVRIDRMTLAGARLKLEGKH